jgi:hypothetical protein
VLPAFSNHPDKFFFLSSPLATAGRSTATRYRYFGGQSETSSTPMHAIINGNLFSLLNELFVHHHRETIDLEDLIRFFRFIQNHGQLRPGSPAYMEIDPNWRDFLVFEIIVQNLFRCL